MPGMDRTGPESKGPMTGRGAGRCGGAADARNNDEEQNLTTQRGPGLARRRGLGGGGSNAAGRGRGMRGGGGRGRGRGA
ncbi:MAG: hypothetical protein C0600_11940 [Ignavibacteria bacterium]|nr:MAG: hypothetical protein C0600_11940 [Ignavibacteria bacterium]